MNPPRNSVSSVPVGMLLRSERRESLAELVDPLHFLLRQMHLARSDVVLEMLDFGSAGNCQHHWRARQQPREDDLRQVDMLVGGEALQAREPDILTVEGRCTAAPERRKRDKGDVLALARGEDLI